MKRSLCLIPALLLVLVFLSGCADETPAPAPVTTVPVTAPATPVVILPAPTTAVPTIERIQALPAERKVNLVLTKDRPTSEIHLQYQGGPGELFINRVMMRVYSTETEYQEFVMSNGRKPLPGDEIIVQGTRQPERCEVFVISSGTRYKVMDENAVGGMYY